MDNRRPPDTPAIHRQGRGICNAFLFLAPNSTTMAELQAIQFQSGKYKIMIATLEEAPVYLIALPRAGTHTAARDDLFPFG